jgi:hypothetical protein
MDAAFGHRLARHACQRFELASVQLAVRVCDPRHLALAGSVIRRGHIDARADELLAIELVRVTARDALELLDGISRRIDLHRALRAAERHIDKRAFVGHQGGKRLHFRFVDLRAVPDAAFRRQLVVAVLGAPGMHDLD